MKWWVVVVLSVLLSACAGQVAQTADGTTADSAAYTRLGMQYIQSGNLAGAKAAFQKAITVAPNDALALNGLALAFQIEGETELANSYFKKAVTYAPESATIHNNYGAFLFAQADYKNACRILAVATQDPFYPRRDTAFENLGRCYLKLGQNDAAKHAFTRVLSLSPNRLSTSVLLADLALKENDLEEAIARFTPMEEAVSERQVEHVPLSLWVGVRIARAIGNAQDATTYALMLKNLFPNSAEFKEFQESGQ